MRQMARRMVQLQVDAGALLEEGAVAEPIRTGYLFQGWTDEAGNGFDFSQPIVEDRTVTAAWKPIMYRVRFEANGGRGRCLSRCSCMMRKSLCP